MPALKSPPNCWRIEPAEQRPRFAIAPGYDCSDQVIRNRQSPRERGNRENSSRDLFGPAFAIGLVVFLCMMYLCGGILALLNLWT